MARNLLSLTWWDEITRRPAARWVAAAAVLALIGGLGIAHYRKIDKGKTALLRWLPQIAELREGKDIFLTPEDGGYTFPHPPFAAAQLIPYSMLPTKIAALIWYLAKWTVFLLSVAMAFAVIQEDGHPFAPLGKAAVFLLSLRPAISDLQHGNINLFVLFWCVLAVWAFKRRWAMLAGVAVAVGVSLKVTPALLLVYFAYKRAWGVCAWVLVGLVACGLLVPTAVFGFDNAVTYSMSWYHGMVEPHIVQGQVNTEHINQSLQSVALRYLTPRPLENPHYPPLFSLSPEVATWVMKGCLFALVIWLGWVTRTPTRRRDNTFLSLEYPLVLLAMPYLNERSWKHHYVVVLLAYAGWVYVILRVEGTGRAGRHVLHPRRWLAFLAASMAIVVLTAPDLIGKTASRFCEWYGTFFLSTVILFAGLALLIMRARRSRWNSLTEALEGPATTTLEEAT